MVVPAHLLNGYLNPLLKLNSGKVKKSAYFQPWFYQTKMRAKIAPNIIKICVQAYLSNGYLNPLSKLNSDKFNKSASFQLWFHQPWTRAKITPNIIKIGVHSYLSKGIHFQNSIPRKLKKVHIFNLGLTNLERRPKSLQIS